MVVRDVHDAETRSAKRRRPARRAAASEAAGLRRSVALRRPAPRERPFEVPDDEIAAPEEAADTGELTRVGFPRERDVPAADERERRDRPRPGHAYDRRR